MPGLSNDPAKAARQRRALEIGRIRQAGQRLGLTEAEIERRIAELTDAAEPIPGQTSIDIPTSSPTPATPAAAPPASGGASHGRGSGSTPGTVAGLPVIDPGATMPPAQAPAAQTTEDASVIPDDPPEPRPEPRPRRRGPLGEFLDGLTGA